jgi:hypothetical protein
MHAGCSHHGIHDPQPPIPAAYHKSCAHLFSSTSPSCSSNVSRESSVTSLRTSRESVQRSVPSSAISVPRGTSRVANRPVRTKRKPQPVPAAPSHKPIHSTLASAQESTLRSSEASQSNLATAACEYSSCHQGQWQQQQPMQQPMQPMSSHCEVESRAHHRMCNCCICTSTAAMQAVDRVWGSCSQQPLPSPLPRHVMPNHMHPMQQPTEQQLRLIYHCQCVERLSAHGCPICNPAPSSRHQHSPYREPSVG